MDQIWGTLLSEISYMAGQLHKAGHEQAVSISFGMPTREMIWNRAWRCQCYDSLYEAYL